MLPKIPTPKKPEKNNGETNSSSYPWCVESTASFWSVFSSGVSGLEDSKLPRPHCCHDTWQSSESHHHERCVARISSLRFFSRGYAILGGFHRENGGVFFFFPGGEGGIHSEQKPETLQQTSKHLGKRLLSEVFAQNQHRRYPMTFLELDSNLYHLSGLSLQRFVFHWRKTCHPAVDFAAKRKGWAPVNS